MLMSLYVRFALQIYYNYANCATLFASMPEAAWRVSPPAAGRLLRQWAWSHIFTRAPGHAARGPESRPQGPFGSAARAVLHGRKARFALRLRPFCNCLPFSPLRGPAPAVAYLYKRGRVRLGSCCVVCLVDVTKNKCFFVFIFVRLHYLCIAGAVPAALAAASVVPPACGGGGHGAMAAIGAGLGR